MSDRQDLKEVLRPFADAYAAMVRTGFVAEPTGTALMYNVREPTFLGPCVHDLGKLAAAFDKMVEEDGGSRL